MSKKCAKCDKTVYPTEELKCLEKIWHKTCFKCQVCNMTLSMGNYKGFDKLPYCGAHVPKAKATIVADTPEMKRLTENSKLQSNVKYHAEFEATKGKFTAVAEDPEMQRLKANSETISNIKYHGVFEQKAEQEKKRSLVNEGPVDLETKNLKSNSLSGDNLQATSQKNTLAFTNNKQQPTLNLSSNPLAVQNLQQQSYIIGYDESQNNRKTSNVNQPTGYLKHSHIDAQKLNPVQNCGIPNLPGGGGGQYDIRKSIPRSSLSYSQQHSIQSRSQPLPPAMQQSMQISRQIINQQDPMISHSMSCQQPQHVHQSQQIQRQQQQIQRLGNDSGYRPQFIRQESSQQINYNTRPHFVPQFYQSPQIAPPTLTKGGCYQAMYDYEAQDIDEVSFKDGDFVVNCTPIDKGWMTGTVHRTGKHGMLPSNYVELVNL